MRPRWSSASSTELRMCADHALRAGERGDEADLELLLGDAAGEERERRRRRRRQAATERVIHGSSSGNIFQSKPMLMQSSEAAALAQGSRSVRSIEADVELADERQPALALGVEEADLSGVSAMIQPEAVSFALTSGSRTARCTSVLNLFTMSFDVSRAPPRPRSARCPCPDSRSPRANGTSGVTDRRLSEKVASARIFPLLGVRQHDDSVDYADHDLALQHVLRGGRDAVVVHVDDAAARTRFAPSSARLCAYAASGRAVVNLTRLLLHQLDHPFRSFAGKVGFTISTSGARIMFETGARCRGS